MVHGFQQWNIFVKHSVLDIWQGSEYGSVLIKLLVQLKQNFLNIHFIMWRKFGISRAVESWNNFQQVKLGSLKFLFSGILNFLLKINIWKATELFTYSWYVSGDIFFVHKNMLYVKLCEIFNRTFFTEQLRAATSELTLTIIYKPWPYTHRLSLYLKTNSNHGWNLSTINQNSFSF